MDKHKLLREDILPAMASNRKVQRLLNEFMDLLSEYATIETNSEQKNPPQPTSPSQPTKDAIERKDCYPAATCENVLEPAVTTADPTLQDTDEMDVVTTTRESQADSVKTTSQTTDQMNIDIPASDQVENAAPSAKQDS